MDEELKAKKKAKWERHKKNLIERYGRAEFNRRYNYRYAVKKRILKGRTHGYCMLCRKLFPREILTIDHKIPLIKGGKNEKSNMQIICRPCHIKKDLKVNPNYKD